MDPEVTARDIRLVETFVGSQHVITSPDMPGLYVAHDDLETARRSVETAVRMLDAMTMRPPLIAERSVRRP